MTGGAPAVAPQTPSRRTTRSTSLASSPTKPLIQPDSPSLPDDLLFFREPITIDYLLSSLPGRESQLRQVLSLIGPVNSPMPPLLICGSGSTGKTSAILQIFKHLNRPLVYASCRSCHSPRILYESILNQLSPHRKSQANKYSSTKRCEREPEFVCLLKDALIAAVQAIKKKKKKKESQGEMIYVVIDNVELIGSWGKSSSFLSVLFGLHDILRIPELGLLFISCVGWDTYYSNFGSTEPVTVFFPNYTEDDLHRIFMKNQANPELYSSFLSVVLRPWCRITRRVDELATPFSLLYQKYCEPLTDKNVIPNEQTKRRLYTYFQPHLKACLGDVFEVPSWLTMGRNKDENSSKIQQIKKAGVSLASKDLDIHMSVSAKYLLISAFLASRNPATHDAATFDPTGGTINKKRRRMSSQTSLAKKEEAAEEIVAKGPGSFPLERLFAIFQCLTSVAEDTSEGEHMKDDVVDEDGNSGLMPDVLLQISTLCNANFLCRSGTCPLEGTVRYRCMINEDMAMKVAWSIRFPLSSYLRK